MRYNSEHKAQVREQVLKEASLAIRAAGVDNVSVAAIMQRVGLTHGGFYAHFKSKDDLVTQAIGAMFDERYGRLFHFGDGSDPQATLTAFITFYLSARHRDQPERGCPIPALNGDVSRLSPVARARFVAGVDHLTTAITGLLAALDRPEPMMLARSMLSELVGAVLLARSNPDPEVSAQILASSQQSIMQRLGLNACIPVR